MLLQDSLGGNAKALMIANLAPSPAHATETLSSLAFASKVLYRHPATALEFLFTYRTSVGCVLCPLREPMGLAGARIPLISGGSRMIDYHDAQHSRFLRRWPMLC